MGLSVTRTVDLIIIRNQLKPGIRKQTYKLTERCIRSTTGNVGIIQSGRTPFTCSKAFWVDFS